ncbi:MAG: hypothetical protein H0U44_10330 [Flavisolibacter sp.]|jgi:hypothetical protein|nr:hypothetical protein [Flavisolibacter sp.]
MILLEMTDGLTECVQEVAFGLSLVISGLFLFEYKKFREAEEKKEMLDQFLND